MKKYKFTILCILAFLLTGCDKDNSATGIIAENNNSIFVDFEYDQERAQQLSYGSPMAISESGYYYILNKILYFYDIEKDINTPLCSDILCKHVDESCAAYVFTTSCTTEGDLSCNCMDKRIFYYDKSLYMVERTKDSDFYLYRYDSGFNNKEQIVKLASMKEKNTMVVDANVATISNGYLYYYTSINNGKYVEEGYNATHQCQRVKLEKGAVPELLGEFMFPGDYAMTMEDSNGLGILTSGEDVYYIAGGTVRWCTAENPINYRIAKFNIEEEKFDILWSYEADEISEVFGEGTGNIVSWSSGEFIKIDEQGNLYILTGEESVGNAIVKIDMTNKTAKKIYSAKYDEIMEMKVNGEYIYFFDIKYGELSQFMIIDTEGNLIAGSELEYVEELLNKYDRILEVFPDAEIGKPVADFANILFYGVDDRYILIGCYADADVFKGLTSSNIFINHDLNRESFEDAKMIGVGVIRLDSIVDGEYLDIKQIFQYTPK